MTQRKKPRVAATSRDRDPMTAEAVPLLVPAGVRPAGASKVWSLDSFLLRYSSSHTRRSYRRDWERFCEECRQWFGIEVHDQSPAGFAHWSEDLMVAWMRQSEQTEKDLSQDERAGRLETRRRMMASLSAYARYLLRKRMLTANPLAFLPKVRPMRAAHQRSEALTPEEMQTVLSHVESRRRVGLQRGEDSRRDQSDQSEKVGGNPQIQARERLEASLALAEVVVWTLLTVGMRVSELTGLRICDFVRDGEHYRLRMSLKGGQEHDPLIHPITAEKIRTYISQNRHDAPQYAPLFVRVQRVRSQGPLTQYGVYKLVNRSIQQAGIDKRVSPHGLRATLATALVHQKIPLAHIRDLLGHQSIQTTNIYVKRASERSDAATLKLDIHRLLGQEQASSSAAASDPSKASFDRFGES